MNKEQKIKLNAAHYSNRRNHSNWISINGKKYTFDREVRYASIELNEYIIVILADDDKTNPKDSGLFCYNAQGKLLWIAETPRCPDGSIADFPYYFLATKNDPKNKLLLVFNNGTPETGTLPGNDVPHIKDTYEGVFYLVDIETGKCLYVRDNSEMFGGPFTTQYYSFKEKKVVDLSKTIGLDLDYEYKRERRLKEEEEKKLSDSK